LHSIIHFGDMDTKKTHYVRHPNFPWQELDGKRIAFPAGRGVHCGETRLSVWPKPPERDDGRYILLATTLVLRDNPSLPAGQINWTEQSLDQVTVDRIQSSDVLPYAKLAGCDLVILPEAT
jgi:hypothetical protein